MSLKGKLTALAGAKIAEKVIPKGSVDGVVNSVLNKLGQATGQKTAAEHIQGIKKKFPGYQIKVLFHRHDGRPLYWENA